jgi:hypothetical protein
MKRFLTVILLVFSLGLTIVYMVVIWKLTFGHLIEAVEKRHAIVKDVQQLAAQKRQNTMRTLQKSLFSGDERVKQYLGYRILDTIRIEGHFHHIDFDIPPDKRSYCNKCHGDMPHNKVKEVRAFWNMHAFFMACETCHVRFDDPAARPEYKWYDRQSGEIVDSPVPHAKPGFYSAKIVPFERFNGSLSRVDSEERIEFAQEFIKAGNSLSEFKKSTAIKAIHQLNSKKPYVCDDCHRKENPLLSLRDLGYPPERIAFLESNEVVGMIEKYKTFFLPDFMKPGP